MTINPLLIAGFACGLAGVALFASSYGILLMMRRGRHIVDELTAVAASRAQGVSELQSQVRELRERLSELEHRKLSPWDWSPEQTAINLNRRGQVLRLLRRGDSAAQIASTLGLSKGEVMLIVKVHELTSGKRNVGDQEDSL